MKFLPTEARTYVVFCDYLKKNWEHSNTMAKRRRIDNTMAKRRRIDNTMAKRRRIDNTMVKRSSSSIYGF
jgi:hypothetical protein